MLANENENFLIINQIIRDCLRSLVRQTLYLRCRRRCLKTKARVDLESLISYFLSLSHLEFHISYKPEENKRFSMILG